MLDRNRHTGRIQQFHQANVQVSDLSDLEVFSSTATHQVAYNQEEAKSSDKVIHLYLLEATSVTKAYNKLEAPRHSSPEAVDLR